MEDEADTTIMEQEVAPPVEMNGDISTIASMDADMPTEGEEAESFPVLVEPEPMEVESTEEVMVSDEPAEEIEEEDVVEISSFVEEPIFMESPEMSSVVVEQDSTPMETTVIDSEDVGPTVLIPPPTEPETVEEEQMIEPEIIAVSSDDATEPVMTTPDEVEHITSTESEPMVVEDNIEPDIVTVPSENVGEPEMEDIVTNPSSESQPAVVERVESPEQVTEVAEDVMQMVREVEEPQIAEEVPDPSLAEAAGAMTSDTDASPLLEQSTLEPEVAVLEESVMPGVEEAPMLPVPIEQPEPQQEDLAPQITIIPPSEANCEPYYARMQQSESAPSQVNDVQPAAPFEEVATEVAPEVESTPGIDAAAGSAETIQTTQQQIDTDPHSAPVSLASPVTLSGDQASQGELEARIQARLARGRNRGNRTSRIMPAVVSEPVEPSPAQVQMPAVRVSRAPEPERYSSRQPEPSSASMTQEQRDQAYKAALKSTAPLAQTVGYQPSLPVRPVSAPMTQEQRDQELKARLRSAVPSAPGASYQPAPMPQPAQPAPMTQEQKDQELKARLRGTAPIAPGVSYQTPSIVQPAPMTQEQKDQALKAQLRSTAPIAHGASHQTSSIVQPVQPAPMTQEQKDQALKAQIRSTAPIAHGASYQTSSVVQSAQPAPMTQEQKDQALKAQIRSTAPIAHGGVYQSAPGAHTMHQTPAPMAQADQDMLEKAAARSGRPARRQQPALTQEEQDANAKARARAGLPVDGPPVVHGAHNYGPPVTTGTVDVSTPASRADRQTRRQQQAEQDAIAKSRARRGLPVEGPPVVPGASAMVSNEETMNELERRREQRAAARAERRVNRDDNQPMTTSSTPKPAIFSNMDEDERQRRYDAKMAQMGQSHADNSQEKRGAVEPEPVALREPQSFTTSTATNFSNMTDDERQRRFDAKMRQMDQNHADRREKYGNGDSYADPAQEQPQPLQQMQSHTYVETSKSEEFRQEAAEQFAPLPSGITTTADRGIAVAPDVEYGEYTQPLVPDDELAVAIAIDDEEEEEEKFYAYAVEYDPESKPPIYKNRRFRLYGLGGACVLIILVVVLVIGLSGSGGGEPRTILITQAPTEAPTEAPTTQIENTYRTFFAKEVNQLVYIPGTPHYRAAEWIMKEDPQMLAPDSARLLQRYIMAFLYFHTTNNEENEWRSCNRPRNGEDDFCVYQEFVRLDNDTITYEGRPGKVRWLSSQNECKWEGVLCAGGTEILGVNLFGQNLTGTLPTELAALPFLQQISFPYNEMEGTIPADYAGLRHLLALEVHGNMLTGTIPDEFYEQDSSSLVLFNVGENLLSGTLDTRIGQMTDLKGLHVFENNFQGNFPTEIVELSYLSFTRFHGNEFTGTLPTQLGRLAQLSELWAHENVFTGSIPSQLGNLRRCQDLRLWGNEMSGSIPEQIYNMKKLFRLSVWEMSLTGTLSTLVGQLTELQILKVNTNKLTGTIPSEIEKLPLLRLAWLHLNEFTGSVPLEICDNVSPGRLEFLQADCFAGSDGSVAPNPCRCCSACCNREDGICLLSNDG